MYTFVKHSHLTFIAITALLFNVRYFLRFSRPKQPLANIWKTLPHINDTLLLFTGLWLMSITKWTPFVNANWLGWKLILLVMYILLGMRALKSTPRSGKSWLFYILTMLCILCIAYLARFKPI